MALDPDIRSMTGGHARRELMRVRQLVRTHRDRREDARCWHADAELYARILPEQSPPGRMDGDKQRLLVHCARYIDRQQCSGCAISRRSRRPRPTAG